METVIKVDRLQKAYGDHEVLKAISFAVTKGETLAVLGVNGAGKTTTLECMQGLRAYQGGSIQMEGSIGVQMQSATLPQEMKVMEAIRLFSKWQKQNQVKQTMDLLNMQALYNKRYGTLSTGQKRRVHLFLALLNNPDILFLDEPTAGLDVEARHELHMLIREIQKQNKTIVLASHDMQEVEELCHHVIILKDGEIAYDGEMNALANEKHVSTIRIKINIEVVFPQFHNLRSIDKSQGWYAFTTMNCVDGLKEVLAYMDEHHINAQDIQIQSETLESRFLEIAKEVSR